MVSGAADSERGRRAAAFYKPLTNWCRERGLIWCFIGRDCDLGGPLYFLRVLPNRKLNAAANECRYTHTHPIRYTLSARLIAWIVAQLMEFAQREWVLSLLIRRPLIFGLIRESLPAVYLEYREYQLVKHQSLVGDQTHRSIFALVVATQFRVRVSTGNCNNVT
jgi:hypothetical protein